MFELEPGTVYLFHAKVQDLLPEEGSLSGFLSEGEGVRAARFRYERDRRRFTLGTGWMRRILGQVRGEDPSSLAFESGDFGKPSLQSGPAFNLSHSGDHILLGVAGVGRLGVDIEVVRPMNDVETLAGRHFSDEEVRAIQACAPEERLRAFLRTWTRKEAFIKALGGGLSVALDSFVVDLTSDAGQALRRADLPPEDEGNWVILPVSVAPEAEAAIAWDHGTPSIVDGIDLLP